MKSNEQSFFKKGFGATRNDVKKASQLAGKIVGKTKLDISAQADFDEVVRLIDAARTRAVSAVNTSLIELYWSVGQYISRKIESAA